MYISYFPRKPLDLKIGFFSTYVSMKLLETELFRLSAVPE